MDQIFSSFHPSNFSPPCMLFFPPAFLGALSSVYHLSIHLDSYLSSVCLSFVSLYVSGHSFTESSQCCQFVIGCEITPNEMTMKRQLFRSTSLKKIVSSKKSRTVNNFSEGVEFHDPFPIHSGLWIT